MEVMWSHYGNVLRWALAGPTVVYVLSTGVAVAKGWTQYGHPVAQLLLWGCYATLAPVVAWYSRDVRAGPTILLAVLLVVNAVSTFDLPTDYLPGSARWVPTAISTTFLAVAFTRPPRQTLALFAATATANALTVTAPFDGISDAGMKLVWAIATPAYGTTIALAAMLALRQQAALVFEQRRRTAAAETERQAVLAVHTDRRRLLEPALKQAELVLERLMTGTAKSADPAVRAAARAAEQRLRVALTANAEASDLAVLAEQLLASSPSRDIDIVTQGSRAWDTLPAQSRERVAVLLHQIFADPATRRINLTALPDATGTVWLSVTVDGGARPVDLPPGLPRPTARGHVDDQWWLEWTLPQHAGATT
ncbi:MAG: hypothetical protein ACRDRA_00860 [Pseudonocardiaceae bacterium]